MPMPHLLNLALSAVRDTDSGRVPDLPQTSVDPDPDKLAVSIMTGDGRRFGAGDEDAVFSIQSMAKAFVYAMALESRGFEAVDALVDVEPSGESYDAISVHPGTGRPDNPMINAGAMMTHSLIGQPGAGAEEREAIILDTFSRLAGRRLTIDEGVFEAEIEQAHRNLAIAHLLKSAGGLTEDPVEVTRGYTRQCAIAVTTPDLAAMAATLSGAGVQPETGERVFSARVVRLVLSVMMACGMYDSAGDWISDVGIPAKSGVSGGIIGAVPGRAGIATYSPRLDEVGTSVRGELLFERLADTLGLHFVDAQHRDNLRWDDTLLA